MSPRFFYAGRIFGVTMLSLSTALSLPSFAQEESSNLEVVTVTGSRTGTEIGELATAISVLDADTLKDQRLLSTDILKSLDMRVPGLNVSTGMRSQCLLKIRGRTPSFQINGVPANQDLRPSNCNSAFQLSPFAVEQVEVVRGATALFGAGAPGGIINIITRSADSEEQTTDVVLQSSFNTKTTSDTFHNDIYVGSGRVIGDWDYYLGYGGQNYQSARDPNGNRVAGTEFTSDALNTNIGYEISDSERLRLTATWYEEDPGQEYDADGAEVGVEGLRYPSIIAVESNPFRNQSRDSQHTLALSFESDEVLGQALNASVFYQAQEYKQRANFQESNGGEADFFSDDRENSTLGLRLTMDADFTIDASTLGLEYGVDYQRNRLLRLQLDPENPSKVVGFIAPEVTLDTLGLFTQLDYDIGVVKFLGGVRYEDYSGEIGDDYAGQGLAGEAVPGALDDASLTLGNFGVVIDLDAANQLYISWNQGAELTQIGRAARRAKDPGLISPEPAVSDQWELGVRGAIGAVNYSTAVFRSESDAASLLQPDPSCAGQNFCPLIPLRVPQKIVGIEATAEWEISSVLSSGAVLTWQDGEIYDKELNRFIPFGSDTVSPTRLSIYAQWQAAESLTLSVQSLYIAKSDFFSASEQEIGFVETDSVWLSDVSARYQLPGVGDFSLGISNLLNEKYENVTASAAGFTPALNEGRRLTLQYSTQF